MNAFPVPVVALTALIDNSVSAPVYQALKAQVKSVFVKLAIMKTRLTQKIAYNAVKFAFHARKPLIPAFLALRVASVHQSVFVQWVTSSM